uniref:MBD domain-containing protein n=1 Tax=Strigamia maritima TaxID=126957 RepID=T1JJ56_STRMM
MRERERLTEADILIADESHFGDQISNEELVTRSLVDQINEAYTFSESVLPNLPLTVTESTLQMEQRSVEAQPASYKCISWKLDGRYKGWIREEHMRQSGGTRGQIDVYYITDTKMRLRNKGDVISIERRTDYLMMDIILILVTRVGNRFFDCKFENVFYAPNFETAVDVGVSPQDAKMKVKRRQKWKRNQEKRLFQQRDKKMMETANLWHLRMGHLDLNCLTHLQQNPDVFGFENTDFTSDFGCENCKNFKLKKILTSNPEDTMNSMRISIPEINMVENLENLLLQPLKSLSMDLWSPYHFQISRLS